MRKLNEIDSSYTPTTQINKARNARTVPQITTPIFMSGLNRMMAGYKYMLFVTAVFLATAYPEASASAQQGLESFFNNTQRFFQEQGRKLKRQLDPPAPKRSHRTTAAPSAPKTLPPMPVANPRRGERNDLAAYPPPAGPKPGSLPPGKKAAGGKKPAAAAIKQTSEDVTASIPFPIRKPEKPVLPESSEEPDPPPHPSKIEALKWTQTQIELARASCESALKGLEIAFEPVKPLRDGVCGAPYPVKVISFGSNPAVSLAPPATMTCEMAASLHKWFESYVQKSAIEQLGTPVVLLRNAASYSCRNRNNQQGGRISEHALANALDISAFVTSDGTTVSVLKDWGIEVIKREAAKAAAESTPPEIPGNTSQGGNLPPGPTAPAVTVQAPDIEARQPALTSGDIAAAAKNGKVPDLPAAHPVPPETPAKPVEQEDETELTPRRAFLNAVHSSACIVFGTVLGPESDAHHRNHFHLDAAQRKYGNYCR